MIKNEIVNCTICGDPVGDNPKSFLEKQHRACAVIADNPNDYSGSDKFLTGPECVRCGRREPWHPDGSCHVFHAKKGAEHSKDSELLNLVLPHLQLLVGKWDSDENMGRAEAPMMFARMKGSFIEQLRKHLELRRQS